MNPRRLLLASMLLALGAASAIAQNVSSSILGIVVDPAGSVVPAAEIKLTNIGTAAVATTTADGAGFFRITNIFAGTYAVTIEAKGFKTLTVNNVEVGTSQARDLRQL